MKKIVKKNLVFILVTVLIPTIGFASTASINAKRSDTYFMGTAVTGVPYYVYGYNVEIDDTNAITSINPPPLAPKLPIAGGGGKTILKNE